MCLRLQKPSLNLSKNGAQTWLRIDGSSLYQPLCVALQCLMNIWSGDQNSECYCNHNDNGAYPARNWGYWENFSCQGPEGEATPTTTTRTQTSNPASCWFITSGKRAASLCVQSEFQGKFMSLLIGLFPFSSIFPHFSTCASARG